MQCKVEHARTSLCGQRKSSHAHTLDMDLQSVSMALEQLLCMKQNLVDAMLQVDRATSKTPFLRQTQQTQKKLDEDIILLKK